VKSGTYADQIHILRIKFKYGSNQPYQFPKDPPNIIFETPIYHTNISPGGSICLDVIKDTWSPMYNIETIFNSIISLLGDPNTSSPFNGEAARQYNKCKDNPPKYQKICEEYYRANLPKDSEHRIWKLLNEHEFEASKEEKFAMYGVPTRLRS
jgi:ubiquitin-protein ligase